MQQSGKAGGEQVWPCHPLPAGLSPSARQPLLSPKLCLRLWTQLEEGLCLGERQGFCNSLRSTCLLTSQANRFFFPQRQSSDPGVISRHTLHCWKGQRGEGREHHLLKVRFWQVLRSSTASASTGMKIELNPAYLKSEGKGWASGRPSHLFSLLSPLPFLGVLQVKSNYGLE